MALKKDLIINGITYPIAVCDIGYIQIYDENGVDKMKYDVHVRPAVGLPVIDNYNGSRCGETTYDRLSPLSAHKQCEAHALTRPEFAGAVQV